LITPEPQHAEFPLGVQASAKPPDAEGEELTLDSPSGEAAGPGVAEVAAECRTDSESLSAGVTDEAEGPKPPPNSVERPAGLRSPEEIHAMLCQRMTALQEKQQSRWRRILAILTGSGGEKRIDTPFPP
jgi:hypothetical protein